MTVSTSHTNDSLSSHNKNKSSGFTITFRMLQYYVSSPRRFKLIRLLVFLNFQHFTSETTAGHHPVSHSVVAWLRPSLPPGRMSWPTCQLEVTGRNTGNFLRPSSPDRSSSIWQRPREVHLVTAGKNTDNNFFLKEKLVWLRGLNSFSRSKLPAGVSTGRNVCQSPIVEGCCLTRRRASGPRPFDKHARAVTMFCMSSVGRPQLGPAHLLFEWMYRRMSRTAPSSFREATNYKQASTPTGTSTWECHEWWPGVMCDQMHISYQTFRGSWQFSCENIFFKLNSTSWS